RHVHLGEPQFANRPERLRQWAFPETERRTCDVHGSLRCVQGARRPGAAPNSSDGPWEAAHSVYPPPMQEQVPRAVRAAERRPVRYGPTPAGMTARAGVAANSKEASWPKGCKPSTRWTSGSAYSAASRRRWNRACATSTLTNG